MKFSIVTISFNQASYLEQAIRSVLEQDYPDVEYIVVDAGSTDGSRDIIDNYRTQIDTIIFEPDDGPADGLNKGFEQATGDIFGFLNSDDLLEPGSLSIVAKYFSKHPSVDVISGHCWIVDSDGNKVRRFYSDKFSLSMAAYGANILCQPSTFFRSDIFNRIDGFNSTNTSSWDHELFIDMGIHGGIFKLVPEFFSQFRIHDQGITGTGKLHKLQQAHRARMFYKIKGRKPVLLDALPSIGARYLRKLLNMPDTYERLLHGPISRSAVK